MCISLVKNDKDGKPLCAKSCTVVLGNFKDSLYQKSQHYAPVIKYISLRLMAAKEMGDKLILQQGELQERILQRHIFRR